MILVIDNYDSFTFNVVQSLQRLSSEDVVVVRSKETTVADIESLHPDRLVISPGPAPRLMQAYQSKRLGISPARFPFSASVWDIRQSDRRSVQKSSALNSYATVSSKKLTLTDADCSASSERRERSRATTRSSSMKARFPLTSK